MRPYPDPGARHNRTWRALKIALTVTALIVVAGIVTVAWQFHQIKGAYETMAALGPEVHAQSARVKADLDASIACERDVRCLLLAAGAAKSAQGTQATVVTLRALGAPIGSRRMVSEKVHALALAERDGQIYKALKRVEAVCEKPFVRCPIPGRGKLSTGVDLLIEASSADLAEIARTSADANKS